jgi:predicted GH43/DUF377 family glycosyl hydrolase
MLKFERHPKNPIVTPTTIHWRSGVVFNPAVVEGPEGGYIMIDRAAMLRPFQSSFGALKSDNAVDFELISRDPVWTAGDVGSPLGDMEDPRITKIGDTYYMTYVYYHSHWNLYPQGPLGYAMYEEIPCSKTKDIAFQARTGVAKSKDCINWENIGWTGPEGWDDKDCVFFPEKIDGKFWMFSRPRNQIGEKWGCERPSIWLRTSEDMETWSEAKLHSQPENMDWQCDKIGASAPPIKTEAGWLMNFHGVARNEYRIGYMLLDLEDPFKIIARTDQPVMEPEFYYEKAGYIIPNCIFTSASIVKDGDLYLYYGACDSVICLATIKLDTLVNFLLEECKV